MPQRVCYQLLVVVVPERLNWLLVPAFRGEEDTECGVPYSPAFVTLETGGRNRLYGTRQPLLLKSLRFLAAGRVCCCLCAAISWLWCIVVDLVRVLLE